MDTRVIVVPSFLLVKQYYSCNMYCSLSYGDKHPITFFLFGILIVVVNLPHWRQQGTSESVSTKLHIMGRLVSLELRIKAGPHTHSWSSQ